MARARRLLLVYNADWSVLGGIRYAVERIREGGDPCALCEITYDGVTESRQWKQCRVDLGVPVEGVFRNSLDAEQARAAGGSFPCVVADTDEGYVRVLARADLERCREREDAVQCLESELRRALERAEVSLTAG